MALWGNKDNVGSTGTVSLNYSTRTVTGTATSFGIAGGSGAGEDGKRQRKSYNIDVKLNAIREAERTSNREVARVLGADEATVRHWRKNEQQLIESKAQGG